MQGSGTFSVEAAINTLVPRDGHVLVLINGAYGKRIAKLTQMMGRKLTTFETADDVPTTAAGRRSGCSRSDPSITHVGLIHCETSTGILNPLPEIAAVVARHGKGLIVDAMSSFGALPIDARTTPFDALVAASGKCVEGPPGMGFVFVRSDAAREAAPATRRRSRSTCTTSGRTWRRRRSGASRRPRTSSWRSMPRSSSSSPEGGAAGAARALHANYETLVEGMAELGFRVVPRPAIQAPIIVTFHAPADPRYTFAEFYERVRDKGFILYPGKLTQVETFRVGCIGAIGPRRDAPGGQRDRRYALAEQKIERIRLPWSDPCSRRPSRSFLRQHQPPLAQPHRPQHVAGQRVGDEQPNSTSDGLRSDEREAHHARRGSPQRHALLPVHFLEAAELQVRHHREAGEHRDDQVSRATSVPLADRCRSRRGPR